MLALTAPRHSRGLTALLLPGPQLTVSRARGQQREQAIIRSPLDPANEYRTIGADGFICRLRERLPNLFRRRIVR
jgi:hypothetical protein